MFVYQFFKADMMYYAERQGFPTETMKSITDAIGDHFGDQFKIEERDEPELLFCKPQSEAEVANIFEGLKDGNDITTQMTSLAELLYAEECNTYLIESNVSF